MEFEVGRLSYCNWQMLQLRFCENSSSRRVWSFPQQVLQSESSEIQFSEFLKDQIEYHRQ